MNANKYISAWKLKHILRRLGQKGFAPRCLEITPLSEFFFGVAFDQIDNEVISDSVFTGFARDPSLALLKAVVEMVERQAFEEGKRKGITSCQTERSDGFAAYPTFALPRKLAHAKARSNALNEAIERFAWATWWDNPLISHVCTPLLGQARWRQFNIDVEILPTHAPIKEIYLIEPKLHGNLDVALKILLVELEDGGMITGGAAGDRHENQGRSIVTRAYSELYRHCLALLRMKEQNIASVSDFYLQRLKFFGFGAGRELVLRRLEQAGSQEIVLPELSFDEEIPHRYAADIIVHRCLFANQPPFVGGDIARLCI